MIFPALFPAASALSAPTGHLPLEGKALSVVILFPHMRVFALTLWGKRFSRIVAFPIGEGGPRQRRSGTFVNGVLEMIFPALFHTASALSAPTGHLPLEGKALSVVILFPHMRVFALTLWGKRYSRIAAFPTRGRLAIRGKPAVKRSSGIAPYIFAAKPPPQPRTLNPEPRTPNLKTLSSKTP